MSILFNPLIYLHHIAVFACEIACFRLRTRLHVFDVFGSAIQIPTTINIFKDIITQTLLTIEIFAHLKIQIVNT